MVGFYSEGRHDVLDVEMGMNISSFQRSITKKYWGEPMDELTTKSIVEDTKTMYPEVEFVRVFDWDCFEFHCAASSSRQSTVDRRQYLTVDCRLSTVD